MRLVKSRSGAVWVLGVRTGPGIEGEGKGDCCIFIALVEGVVVYIESLDRIPTGKTEIRRMPSLKNIWCDIRWLLSVKL